MSQRRPPGAEPGRGTAHLSRGLCAEQLAARWISARGARIVARNFRVRGGELDLLAVHQGCLAAVEVRFRTRPDPVDPLATITRGKCRRLVHALECFVNRYPAWQSWPLRFDVVSICGDLDARPAVRWWIAAFDLDDLL